MSLKWLANLINRHWALVLIAWVVMVVVLKLVAPSWDSIAKDGDLDYLPKEVTSLQGQELLREAFPNEKAKSQAVLALSRNGGELQPEDRAFGLKLSKTLANTDTLPLVDVWDEKTQVVGGMLVAPQNKAVMVVVRLTNGLMDVDNVRLLEIVHGVVDGMESERPDGLEVSISGSAMIGGDMRSSIEESLSNTERTTVLLVLVCLVAIYRAPLLVLVPLATIAVSMSVANDVVALLADNFGPDDYAWSDFKIFTTTKIFVVVILFGAGTDFCLFLISRFKEELVEGAEPGEAPGRALLNVSGALAGSAFTTILGLSTMAFAQYGKFVSSGPIIAVCLFFALLACMSFAPALLRAFGKQVFWPFGLKLLETEHVGETPAENGFWAWVSDQVMRRPTTILLLSAWLVAPFIFIGLRVGVTHDFMADLAPDRTSVVGAEKLREYFSQGVIAPMTVVAELPEDSEVDLGSSDGRYTIARLHTRLLDQEAVDDVRSVYLPTGGDPRHRRTLGGGGLQDLTAAGSPITAEAFVSQTEPYAGKVTQVSVLLNLNPFSKAARDAMPGLHASLKEFAKEQTIDGEPNPWHGARFELVGTTPGMRDLEVVTNSDRWRIQILTVIAVYLVLIFLLRKPFVCAYMILTVLLSYWATLGMTEIFFEWLYGDTFRGLDWKVPIFLFVILIAVGQDYNIYLATRVFEEQARLGARRGLRRAIVTTGGIITSCGVIMAGTFFSMATGTLRGMAELGFALALGVVLDTFFVRTVVVPSFFALLARVQEPLPLEGAAEPGGQHASDRKAGVKLRGDGSTAGHRASAS
ncbi:putative membrane protein YdgH [Pseudobythopirellula maris]|uniref:Putative membrane protein YdgH n=1 Tax=Pseudobythopirellula maris TaxID=2527991 RepID=A0A5C5ZUW2_9BACT|nr:MMPL family transporter [Pseudobythopirellula maris]TWT90691.1 putative membrane protein YdgH [Pseudobythopirellula maris]